MPSLPEDLPDDPVAQKQYFKDLQHTTLSILLNNISNYERKLDADAAKYQAKLDAKLMWIDYNATKRIRIKMKTSGSSVLAVRRLLAHVTSNNLIMEEWERAFREEWKKEKRGDVIERGEFLNKKLTELLGISQSFEKEKIEIVRKAGVAVKDAVGDAVDDVVDAAVDEENMDGGVEEE
jgi:hypothetical protein